MHGEGLGHQDEEAASRPVGERRERDLADLRALALEDVDGRIDRLPRRLARRVVGLVEMADHTDLEALGATP